MVDVGIVQELTINGPYLIPTLMMSYLCPSQKVSVTTVVPKQEIREDPSFEASRLVEEEGLEQEIRASQSLHPDHTRSDNSQEQDESTL